MSALDNIKEPILRSRSFLEECWSELKKVHFPNRQETQGATIVVVVGVVIVALYLFVIDNILRKLMEWFLV